MTANQKERDDARCLARIRREAAPLIQAEERRERRFFERRLYSPERLAQADVVLLRQKLDTRIRREKIDRRTAYNARKAARRVFL